MLFKTVCIETCHSYYGCRFIEQFTVFILTFYNMLLMCYMLYVLHFAYTINIHNTNTIIITIITLSIDAIKARANCFCHEVLPLLCLPKSNFIDKTESIADRSRLILVDIVFRAQKLKIDYFQIQKVSLGPSEGFVPSLIAFSTNPSIVHKATSKELHDQSPTTHRLYTRSSVTPHTHTHHALHFDRQTSSACCVCEL